HLRRTATSLLSGRYRLQRRSWMGQSPPVCAGQWYPTFSYLNNLCFSPNHSAGQLTSLVHDNNIRRNVALRYFMELWRRSNRYRSYDHPYLLYGSILHSNRDRDRLVYSGADRDYFLACNRLYTLP